MPKLKRNPSLRKKTIARKTNRRNKRTSRKARGYTNECIIPAPSHNRQDKESCRQVDLQDDYGNTMLTDKGLSGDKECNMYYYILTGKYYRCRNAGKNKCNKTGKYGMKRMSCRLDTINRIEGENRQLEGELQDLINPSARYPSVPRTIHLPSSSFPSVPSHTPSVRVVYPSVPTHAPTSRTSNVRSTLKRTSKSRVSPPRSSMRPSSSRETRKLLPSETRKQLATNIDSLLKQNQKYEGKKQELRQRLKDGKTRGNVTKQMERMMAKQHKMFDVQIKRNEAIVNNLQRMVK